MRNTVVVLVNGEVLADGNRASTIPDQRDNAIVLAEGLLPLLCSDLQVAILHGNKPQVGFVLFRSELASHILHPIPLDVCGADTQGATGYMLSQAMVNALRRRGKQRMVMCVLTQTVVDPDGVHPGRRIKAIGPWFDRDRAEHYRQARNWQLVEEPGRGYRRAVPAPQPIEIVEIGGIRQLLEAGAVVVAAGGGGIPVVRTAQGNLEGVEAVVDTDHAAYMVASQLQAKVLLMVIESDDKFILSRLSTEGNARLSVAQAEALLAQEALSSNSVRSKLLAAAQFLRSGGEQVIITTLRRLPDALAGRNGLCIGAPESVLRLPERG